MRREKFICNSVEEKEAFKGVNKMEKLDEEAKWREKKQKESRRKRTTLGFYDKEYWDIWEKRWGAVTNEHDERVKHETLKKVQFLTRRGDFYKSKTALDIGCSFGFFVQGMRELGIDAHGCDVSKEAIEKAPEQIKKYLKVMDVKSLKFHPDQFELVTVWDLLEHLYVEEFMKAIKEINRVASKYIIISSPLIGWRAEPWLTDLSYHDRVLQEHVSTYPWDFWARRFTELNKFDFWFCELWNGHNRGDDTCPERMGHKDMTVEGYITFKRK